MMQECFDNQIEILVEKWHQEETGMSLIDYLGMTVEEYVEWVIGEEEN